MLTGFLGFIGFIMLLDVLSRRHWRWQSPTIIVGSLAALNCFMMLPFVNNLVDGYSVGFVLASLGVTVFLSVFFYVAFFTSPMSTPTLVPVKKEWYILGSLDRLAAKLNALRLEKAELDLEDLRFAQKLSSRTAHQIHEYYFVDEWKHVPKSLQDELRRLAVVLLNFGESKDDSKLLALAKQARKSTNETIALLRQ
jgi:hypothetical protein